MNPSPSTRPYMQAAEREEDFVPRDHEPSRIPQEQQSMISTIDPITGNDVGNVQDKPSLVDGHLTMYFESEQTRQTYLDEQKHQH